MSDPTFGGKVPLPNFNRPPQPKQQQPGPGFYPLNVPGLGGLSHTATSSTPGPQPQPTLQPQQFNYKGKHAGTYNPKTDINASLTTTPPAKVNGKTVQQSKANYSGKHRVGAPQAAASAAALAAPPVNPNFAGKHQKLLVQQTQANPGGAGVGVLSRYKKYNLPPAPPGNAAKATAAVKKYGAAGLKKNPAAQAPQKNHLNAKQFGHTALHLYEHVFRHHSGRNAELLKQIGEHNGR